MQTQIAVPSATASSSSAAATASALVASVASVASASAASLWSSPSFPSSLFGHKTRSSLGLFSFAFFYVVLDDDVVVLFVVRFVDTIWRQNDVILGHVGRSGR